MHELEVLDKHYDTYRKDSTQDNIMRELTVRTFKPFIKNIGTGLELGCSDGYMTEMLSQHLKWIDVVEGSARFIKDAKKRNLSNVAFHHALFDDFKPEKKYDYIFISYVLTHVPSIDSLFEMTKSALKSGGLIFIVVPNARALSRQLALHMGFIDDLKMLSENEKNHGHMRAYDRQTLNIDLSKHGFNTIAQGGIMLKQLADFQMDQLFEKQILRDEHIEGLYKLGLEYPDLCSAIYSICTYSE